jgi:hypothetical protein
VTNRLEILVINQEIGRDPCVWTDIISLTSGTEQLISAPMDVNSCNALKILICTLAFHDTDHFETDLNVSASQTLCNPKKENSMTMTPTIHLSA